MFDWFEYFDLARNLARQNDEASQRSAVSRAYYAAFCSARNRLRQEQGAIPKTDKVHQIVWEQFENSTEKKRKQLAQYGKRLRRERNKVDYDDEIRNLDYFVRDAMETANRLISLLRSL
jgi:uncharacterized protein (UPF0332 family)